MKPIRRILYIAASTVWGGGEQYISDLMVHLDAEGYDCRAIVPGSDVGVQLCDIVGIKRVCGLPMRSMFDGKSADMISRMLRSADFDIIHVNKFADAFIAVKARRMSGRDVKVVMTRHLVRKGKTGWLYRRLYEQLDALVFVSDIARQAFMKRSPKIDEAKVRVIHNGVPDAPQQEPKHWPQVPVIAYVGRIAKEKGVNVLIDALGMIKDMPFKVRITGNGDAAYIAELTVATAKRGIFERVEFTGFTDDVNAALQEASIGVAPTIVPEGFGLAVVEYMRSSLAVVTTNNGAQREYLENEKDALLVPPSDAEALAKALRTLLNSRERCKELGENARQKFLSELVYDKSLARTRALYHELTENKQ
jgi:glycosyltransferase involved in cell wall biosynthesis